MQTNQVQASPTNPPILAYISIFAMVASISLAAILIRLALLEDMPPLMIAGARLFVAVVVLTPLTLRRYQSYIRNLSLTELSLATLSGFFLAIHFIAWVTSLQYTTVLVSVVIVTTGPIWVAILEVIFLRVRLSQLVIIGLAIALLGGVFIGIPLQSDTTQISGEQDTTLIGAFLSWIGAITVSVYMLIGRKLRSNLPVIPYIWLVYTTAMIVIAIALIVTATPVIGYSFDGYLILLMMGLIPQLIGHSSLNYVLEYFPATFVSMFTQLEPIGSAILALIIFAEVPPTQQIIGSAIIIFGVLLASRGKVSQLDKRA